MGHSISRNTEITGDVRKTMERVVADTKGRISHGENLSSYFLDKPKSAKERETGKEAEHSR